MEQKNKKRGAKNPTTTLKRLFSYMWRDYKVRLFLVIFCILISAFANVQGSLFIRRVIDDYITPMLTKKHANFSGLQHAIFKMAILYLIGILATFTFNLVMVKVSQGTQKKIRDELFEHMEKLPIRYFDERSQGDIMSHYTNDIDTLRQMISQSLPNLFAAFVTFLSVFIAMVTVSFPMTLFVIVSVSLMLLTIRYISGKAGRYFSAQQHSLGKLNGYIEEMIHGQKVIKLFNHEKDVLVSFDKVNEELQHNATNANMRANTLMPIMMNLLNIQYCLIAVIGGVLSVKHFILLSVGQLASFLQLSRSLNNPIAQVSQQINFVIMALAGAERLFQLMDEPVEEDTGTIDVVKVRKVNHHFEQIKKENEKGIWAFCLKDEKGKISYRPLKGDVSFEHVTFGYNDEKMVLKDIQLYAKPGQKVAFVGSTGAGKTTITNLINRFYDIQQGNILYDGIDIKKIRKKALRKSLGIVLQDTHLFTGTVKENIRYGRLDATDEDVFEAAQLSNADIFIKNLPQGYDTVITGDGEGLSQGQKQLLAIARAAIANPPVMILDEATSSIDTRTEGIVQKGMDSLMQGRTVFVIAHRLSTVQNSDVIMVLDHGKIIERGDHDTLLSLKGVYHQLYTGTLELS